MQKMECVRKQMQYPVWWENYLSIIRDLQIKLQHQIYSVEFSNKYNNNNNNP